MVTAILPSLTVTDEDSHNFHISSTNSSEIIYNSEAPTLQSETTIESASIGQTATGQANVHSPSRTASSSPPRLAGIVGLFTGCGALVALSLFLPLPAQFSHLKGVSQGQAVADSFYVVGCISIFVAGFCLFGLRDIRGEEGKGWGLLFGRSPILKGYEAASQSENQEGISITRPPFLPYWKLLVDSAALGLQDYQIGMGYLGGFVARASSVAISLFIPLYVNAYFIQNGFCQGSPKDPSPELKKECRAAVCTPMYLLLGAWNLSSSRPIAPGYSWERWTTFCKTLYIRKNTDLVNFQYVLAAELTGMSQLVALLCAPIFGYLSDRYRRFNSPLLISSAFGIVGHIAFATMASPEPSNVNGRGGSPVVFFVVALIGVSQIGAIVCSLGLLGRGVLGAEGGYNLSSQLERSGISSQDIDRGAENEPLTVSHSSRRHLKGSIAGVYSLSGGVAILLLTKIGGKLFDSLSARAPFYIMALQNAVLLAIGVCAGIYQEFHKKKSL
jgi:hypothetical protein